MISEDEPGKYSLLIPRNILHAAYTGNASSMSQSSEETTVDVETLKKDLIVQYKYLKEKSKIQPKECKSNVEATEFRNLGNEKFKNNEDSAALELYTKSISTAVDGSEELALGYAHRSAVLLRISKLGPCLFDINRALEGNYTENLKKKLRVRKKDCLIRIRNASDDDPRLKLLKADATDPIVEKNPLEDAEWRNLCRLGNPLISNASPKVKIDSNEQWGRFLAAAEDIEPGEILSWQKFAVLSVKLNRRYENCAHCLQRCYALIPCPTCSWQMYCSKQCRTLAYNLYHRTECPMLSFTTMSSKLDDFRFIAVRMMLIGTDQGTQLRTLMTKLPLQEIFSGTVDPPDKPFVNDYLAALKLRKKFHPDFIKWNSIFVMEMIVILQKIGFFVKKSKRQSEQPQEQTDVLNDVEMFTAMLIMNHAVSTRWNTFSVSPITSSDMMNVDLDKTASGICTLHNILNHSCDSDAHFFMRNRKHVLMAVRRIKKGEQIFCSYFNSFVDNPLPERIRQASNFGFACECRACVNQWPLEEELVKMKVEFIAVENKEKEMDDLAKIVSRCQERGGIANLSNQEILQNIRDVCKWLGKNIKPPSASMVQCGNILLKFTMLLYDDFSREFLNDRSREYVQNMLEATWGHTYSLSK